MMGIFIQRIWKKKNSLQINSIMKIIVAALEWTINLPDNLMKFAKISVVPHFELSLLYFGHYFRTKIYGPSQEILRLVAITCPLTLSSLCFCCWLEIMAKLTWFVQ